MLVLVLVMTVALMLEVALVLHRKQVLQPPRRRNHVPRQTMQLRLNLGTRLGPKPAR